MRSILIIGFFGLLGISSAWSQSPIDLNWKIKRSNFRFSIPKPSINYYYLDRNESVIEKYSLMIYKSPIKHTAFFCNLEAKTQKKFGVMFQFHVGNYQSYMDYKIPY